MKKFFNVALVFMLAALASCSNTKLRDIWQAESFHHDDFTQVMVIASTENITNRLIFETEFATQLEKRGIEVFKSNVVLGNHKPDRDEVIAYAEKHNIKYVLATRVADVEVDKNYVQPTAAVYSTGGYYYPGYYHGWGGWGGSSTLITTEGYMDTNETFILETVIFKSSTKELVWAAKTASFDVRVVSYIADDIARITVKNIKK